MRAKVAATCFSWSQPVVPHSPSLSQVTIVSAYPSSSSSSSFSLSSSFRRTLARCLRRSGLFGVNLPISRSRDIAKSRGHMPRSYCSASSEGFSDEEFAKSLQELALRFHLSQEEGGGGGGRDSSSSGDGEVDLNLLSEKSKGREKTESSSELDFSNLQISGPSESAEAPWLAVRPDPLEWPRSDEIISGSVERKANSVDLPLSLRMLKRKKRWQKGFREVGESTYCSIRRAFSSMVFMIRELQTYTLHMREVLYYQDLQGILVRVHREMHASFIWLFQHIFSRTPTLMVYVMILLANFTVHSMDNGAAVAALALPVSYTESVTAAENHRQPKFDSRYIKTFSISGRTASIGGDGGGKVRPVAGATDGGDGRFEVSKSQPHSTIFTDDRNGNGNPKISREEEEEKLWNSMVEEASRIWDVSFDHETMQRFVSSISVEMEPEDYTQHFGTELMYQRAISEDPNNPLTLCNYAQFLYLVVHDHERAEDYFKRAVRVEPPDADSLSRYASFLWLARNDVGTAEEVFLEAIAADPSNTFHAANYAHFLWNTGAEDTCYPLTGNDS